LITLSLATQTNPQAGTKLWHELLPMGVRKISQGYETNWSSHQDYRVHSLLVGNVRARADDRPRLLIFCFLYGVYRKTFLSEVHISVHA